MGLVMPPTIPSGLREYSHDFGARFEEASTDLDRAKPPDFNGENLVLEVPLRAAYVFRLNVKDPHSPLITVRRQATHP
jgi:hypothetical protein